MTKPPTCCDRWRWKTDQRGGEFQPLPRHRRVGVEAGFLQARAQLLAAVEPLVALGEAIDALLVQAQRLADIAHCAARAVGGQCGGQCRAVGAVLVVDVLDDLLAPLVLEVHVDVGRLVAFAADEAFEQERRLGRVDLGDAQAIADRRVGRRTSALAQDCLLSGVAHDVVHRQEEGFVAQLFDQQQFLLYLRPNFLRHAERVALSRTDPAELSQVADRRLAGRHDLGRVFVAQLVERKVAAFGQPNAGGQPLGPQQSRQRQARAQVLLAVARQRQAAVGYRALQAGGGQRVMQGLARARVHQHVTRGDQRHAARLGCRRKPLGMHGIVGPEQQLDGDGGAVAEGLPQPARLRQQGLGRLLAVRDEKSQAVGQAAGVAFAGQWRADKIVHRQAVTAFLAAAAAQGDEPAELGIAFAVHGQQYQAAAGRVAICMERELGSDEQLQGRALLTLQLVLLVRPHHAGDRTFVGDRDGRIAELRGPRHQFAGVRGAGQEAEVGAAMQFGIGRQPGLRQVRRWR